MLCSLVIRKNSWAALIIFEHIYKNFSSKKRALSDLCFEVREGETLVLLGRSGSGKTTSLKMINRLIEPSSGKILIHGKDIQTFDPIYLRRNIGYAIQHVGLFKHMTVEENIGLVPKLLGWVDVRIRKRVEELLYLIGLNPEDVRNSYPHQLSGGQKQRIGVARAIAADPPIILMDEPFGALDPMTREQLQNEFLELERDIRKTVVFVTHDVFEAIKMADRIAVMEKGQILQIGTPRELLKNPVNEIVDQFFSQHRYQLSLMTQTVSELIQDKIALLSIPRLSLHPKATFLDALNLFNKSKTDSISIFDGKNYLGEIRQAHLLKESVKFLK